MQLVRQLDGKAVHEMDGSPISNRSSQVPVDEPTCLRVRLEAGNAQTRQASRLGVTCHASCYSFRIEIAHKGLLAFYERGDARRIPASLVPRIRRILSDLDAAVQPGDMNLPGYRLHPLTGDRRGQWSVRVSGNWRVVFRFEDGVPVGVTLVDYH